MFSLHIGSFPVSWQQSWPLNFFLAIPNVAADMRWYTVVSRCTLPLSSSSKTFGNPKTLCWTELRRHNYHNLWYCIYKWPGVQVNNFQFLMAADVERQSKFNIRVIFECTRSCNVSSLPIIWQRLFRWELRECSYRVRQPPAQRLQCHPSVITMCFSL